MFLVVSLFVLTSLCPRVTTYSRGAPDSACSDNMEPRHGYSVQVHSGEVKRENFTFFSRLAHPPWKSSLIWRRLSTGTISGSPSGPRGHHSRDSWSRRWRRSIQTLNVSLSGQRKTTGSSRPCIFSFHRHRQQQTFSRV